MAEAVQSISTVVVPIEGSSQEMVAQEWAVQMAAAVGAQLTAVHVATSPKKAPGDIFDYVTRLCKRHDVRLETKHLNGADVAEELVEELTATDLVVIGTRLLGTEYHMGSVTEGLIRRAPCPVQVIRL